MKINKLTAIKEVSTAEEVQEQPIIEAKTENEEFYFCQNAVTNLSEEEYDDKLDEMYKDIDEKYINELEEMKPTEINSKMDSFDDKYQLGEALSEEDAAKVLYVYEKMNAEQKEEDNNASSDGIHLKPLAQVTRIYNIGWSKEKGGVKTSYDGKFKTWVGTLHGKYETDVEVKVEKGKKKLKSMKWTTYHNAYGILGTSGKSVSIGKVYTGKVSSDEYKKKFSYEKSKTYTAVLTCLVSTYGELQVKYDGGEYSINTKTYKSIE